MVCEACLEFVQNNDVDGLVQRAMAETLFAHPEALAKLPRKRRFLLLSEHARNLRGLAVELVDFRKDDGEPLDLPFN